MAMLSAFGLSTQSPAVQGRSKTSFSLTSDFLSLGGEYYTLLLNVFLAL